MALARGGPGGGCFAVTVLYSMVTQVRMWEVGGGGRRGGDSSATRAVANEYFGQVSLATSHSIGEGVRDCRRRPFADCSGTPFGSS
jgi:hypothetical protein